VSDDMCIWWSSKEEIDRFPMHTHLVCVCVWGKRMLLVEFVCLHTRTQSEGVRGTRCQELVATQNARVCVKTTNWLLPRAAWGTTEEVL